MHSILRNMKFEKHIIDYIILKCFWIIESKNTLRII